MSVIAQKTTAELYTEEGRVRLTYCLLSQPVQAEETGAGEMTEYGVRIEMKGPGEYAETAEIQGVTCSEHDMLVLLARMAAGTVTPVALADIVDDFLAQQ